MAAKPRTRRHYAPDEIEQAMAATIISGSSLRAEELTGIPSRTIRAWCQEQPERYEAMRTQLHGRVAEQIASNAESLVHRITEKEGQVLDALDVDKISQLDAKDIAGTLRNLSTSKALQVDKISSPLRERPSHVQQLQGLDQLIKRMEREMGFDASSTAVEITDAPAQLDP
jgi:hypothetical protein